MKRIRKLLTQAVKPKRGINISNKNNWARKENVSPYCKADEILSIHLTKPTNKPIDREE